jgi:hypothetical protein
MARSVPQIGLSSLVIVSILAGCVPGVYKERQITEQERISQESARVERERTEQRALTKCIVANMEGKKYASARETGQNSCGREMGDWRKACQNKYSPWGFDDIAARKCDSEYRELANALDRQWESTQPPPPAQTNLKMDAALRDLAAHRTLPGLPDLKKPVFVTSGSLICKSPGALANPNTQALLMTGSCVVFDHKIRVSVFSPRDRQEYLNDHLFNMVLVGWRSDEISSANVFTGWVQINRLGN